MDATDEHGMCHEKADDNPSQGRNIVRRNGESLLYRGRYRVSNTPVTSARSTKLPEGNVNCNFVVAHCHVYRKFFVEAAVWRFASFHRSRLRMKTPSRPPFSRQ